MSKQQASTKLVKKPSGKASVPQLGDSQEGTEEHIEDSKSATHSRTGLADSAKGKPPKPNPPSKKGKIVVDLKHSGDFKAFDNILKDLTAKMDSFKSSIAVDPVSVINQQVTESLMMSMLDAAMHREQPALRTLAKNMEDYSTKGFQTNSKLGSDSKPKQLNTQPSGAADPKKQQPAEEHNRGDKKKTSVVSKDSDADPKKKEDRPATPEVEESKAGEEEDGNQEEERELNEGAEEAGEEEGEAEQEQEEQGEGEEEVKEDF